MSRALAALALLAMAMRAMVPAGYMLTSATTGDLISVTLCSGHEAAIDLATGAIVGTDRQEKSPSDGSGAEAPCAFAAAASLSAPVATAAIQIELRASPARPPRDAIAAPGRGLAAPPPWSTGPPLTA